MKEPTTVKDAKQLTLKKILECMELPKEERNNYWRKDVWSSCDNCKRYCAFCHVADYFSRKDSDYCKCVAQTICIWFSYNVLRIWLKKDLRKLYKMVEAIEC